jgi:Carboxypeptidase regulatory-like domain
MIHFAAVLIFLGQSVISPVTQAPPRDRVPPPRTGTCVVKGRVVDGTTGTAVARARVMLQGPGAGAPAVTDADGAFTFTNLPPGPVTLMAQKSTYLPARYPAGGRTMRAQARPLILRDGQALDNIVVPLFHGGSITGRVFDANGDPVEFAQVSLLRLPSGGRAGKPTMRQGTQTNDLGEFRLGRIEEGTYAVQVSARRDEMMFGPMPPQAQPPPPLPQPVPTFYPGAVSIDQAQPIVVERAQAVTGIDVVLGEGMPGVVTGVVLMPDGQALPANTYPNVMIRRVLSDVQGGYDSSMSGAMTRPDGTFRTTLPPGDYMFEARLTPRSGGPSKPEDELVASQRVTVVSGGEESLVMTVGPGAMATGRVVFEGNTPVPPSPGRTRIPLFSEGNMCRSGEAEVAADWSFRIAGLSGTCSAQPMGFFGRWILKAVTFNGQNLLDGPVTFQPGQQLRNVQVVVTDRQSSMTFQVSDENGQTTRDYVVVAYPVEKGRWTNGARTYMPPIITNPDAMRSPASLPGPANAPPMRPASLSGLRTGEYYVVAVDDLEFEDVRDPGVLERLRSGATRVTLTEGATVEVPLRRANFADLMRQR